MMYLVKKLNAIVFSAILLTGCNGMNPRPGCGLLACVTSPYVKARGGQNLVGQPIAAVFGQMGGAPTSTYKLDDDTNVLTWTRDQSTDGGGHLSCSESMQVRQGVVTSYSAYGNC